jgi:hypothetical protein
MDNIYGWYPSKNEWMLIFEFVDWIEKEVKEDFIEDQEMLDKLHDIQNLVEEFYDNYLSLK